MATGNQGRLFEMRPSPHRQCPGHHPQRETEQSGGGVEAVVFRPTFRQEDEYETQQTSAYKTAEVRDDVDPGATIQP